ncbi:MAG: hypothetical protein COB33_015715 [Thiotrichaceae bacterium]|nr:hypothetical protein [Thiotrichaceae bacterium]PCI12818.1 MAG: hypothetical protein COB71_08030 [Thiotrichales bacterium]
MSIQQKPNVGSWYINLTGQLLKVWAVSYSDAALSKVVVEYLSGSRVVIDIDQWNLLDLEINFEKIARRKKVEESQR